MITIGEVDRINLYQLAKRSRTNRTYIGHLTKRLESLGMVRIDSSHGKKPIFVEATEKGRKVADLLKESSRTIWQEIAEGGSMEPRQNMDVSIELNPKYLLQIRDAIDGYNMRIMSSEGTFSLNINIDKSKIKEIHRQTSSILEHKNKPKRIKKKRQTKQ
jgi:DNA-binding MarR family transcriptional regulator